eukprot:m.134725 g.134725  ORF g.134725 m.134725 type:complete len:843 (-) comp23882_c0_seq1:267-2795(-)
MMLWLATLLPLIASSPTPVELGQTVSPEDAAMAVAERVLGAPAAANFKFGIKGDCGSAPRCFQLSASSDNTILIEGPTANEMTKGLGFYLRTYCNMSFTWQRSGGNQITIPNNFPLPGGVVKKDAHVKYTYDLNVVTIAYSNVWYDWAAWQYYLDWCALSGINLQLSYTGQEYLYKKVFNQLGVNDTVLQTFFDGPAYLAWSRGQGMSAVGGPLPVDYMISQWNLNKQIVQRQTELGIASILPAFQGNVPAAIAELYPKANISHNGATRWLDCKDPLFPKIADMVMDELLVDFGKTGFYEADGTFALNTGPWLPSPEEEKQEDEVVGDPNTICIYSSEMKNSYLPGCAANCEAFASFNEAKAACTSLLECAGITKEPSGATPYQLRSGLEPYQSPSGESSWVITNMQECHPTPEDQDAKERAEIVWNTIVKHDPDATWIFQGWIWLGQKASYIKGFTAGVPKGRLVILDMEAEFTEIWRRTESFFNASFVWCSMNNFGGVNALYGDIEDMLNRTSLAFATAPSIEGVGITMEGILQNPPYYQAVLDTAWIPSSVSSSEYLQQWGKERCGKQSPSSSSAWAKLSNTVYASGQAHSLHHFYVNAIVPSIDPNHETKQIDHPNYNVSILYSAWSDMINAVSECNTNQVAFDVVDIGRQYLAAHVMYNQYRCLQQAYNKSSLSDASAAGQAIIEAIADLDSLLNTQEGFSMGKWIEDAKSLSNRDEEKVLLEWNARSQVTLWEPYPKNSPPSSPPGLTNYATKTWGGLSGSYHKEIYTIFVKHVTDAISNKKPFDNDAFIAEFLDFAVGWENTQGGLPVSPVGDSATVAAALLQKYPLSVLDSCPN